MVVLPLVSRAALLTCAVLLCALFVVPAVAQTLPGAGVLALESNRDGDWRIYLYDVGTRRLPRLTRLDGEEHAPSWRADGSRLAFHADRDGDGRSELYAVSPFGGDVVALNDTGPHNWRPVWSPDGRSVAYIRGFGLLTLLDVDTGEERPVGEGFGQAWSPDGRYLVAYRDPDGRLNADLFLIETGRATASHLTLSAANEWSPAWSPDGEMIAYSSPRDSSHAEIYLMDAACIDAANLTGACGAATRRLTYNDVNETAAAWSPDGRSLAVVVEDGGLASIYQVDIATGESRLLVGGDADYHQPAWQP